MPQRVASSPSARPATSICSASLSTTQGPAIRNSGLVEADVEAAELHCGLALDRRRRSSADARAGAARRPAAHARAARAPPCTKLSKSGWPRRGVDVNSGWNWQPKNHGWSASSIISHRSLGAWLFARALDDQPGRLEPRQVMVVDLVAVAVALGDDVAAVDAVRERARGTRSQGCAPSRIVPPRSELAVAPLDRAVAVLPLGDERDHRVRRLGIELGAVARPRAPRLWRAYSITASCMPRQMPRYGHAVLARVADRRDLALDAALAEAARARGSRPCPSARSMPSRSIASEST